MRIEPLSTKNLREGILCAGNRPHSEVMYRQMEAWLNGDTLRGQIAYADGNDVAGFVLYSPIERAPVAFDGEGFYMVQCLLVKPELTLKGYGSGLIGAALQDAAENDRTGLAAQGFLPNPGNVLGPVPGSFFEKMGMQVVESRGNSLLYFSRIQPGGREPGFIERNFQPLLGKDRLRVDILDCRNCYSAVRNIEVTKQVVADLNQPIDVSIHNQNSRKAVLDKGMSTGVFIDGNLTFFGNVTSQEDIINAFETALAARRRGTDR